MDQTVMLGHGSGGSMMKRIIDEVFLAAYPSAELLQGNDAAVLPALGLVLPGVGEFCVFWRHGPCPNLAKKGKMWYNKRIAVQKGDLTFSNG